VTGLELRPRAHVDDRYVTPAQLLGELMTRDSLEPVASS
jgi:hypothetical protein